MGDRHQSATGSVHLEGPGAAAALAAIVVLIGAGGATEAQASTNLIANGGFESGDFSSWSLAGTTGTTAVQATGFDGFTAVNGSDFAVLNGAAPGGSLSQTFTDKSGTF